MRLIDGDELLSIVRRMTVVDKSVMYHTLIQMPTVDAVPVVRCRDCKRHDRHDHRCKWWNHGVSDTDYCSYAERKERRGNADKR